MTSSNFSALTLSVVSRPRERFDRALLYRRATDFIKSFGGEVDRVSGKKGYVSLARVHRRLAPLLAMEEGFELMAGHAPFRTAFDMDDWTFTATIDDNFFVLSKVLCGDAEEVAVSFIDLAATLPSIYMAHFCERRCDRGPALAELGIALGLTPNDPEGFNISRWFNAREDRTWEPYLRDVYPLNILSADALELVKVGDGTLGAYIKRSSLGTTRPLGADRFIWELPECDRLTARAQLLALDVLIVGHAAGTLSQSGVVREIGYETV